MFPIVNSESVASLEIVEMYKINGRKKTPAGKEILGHAFKSCLTKNKFLSENGNNFSVQFAMLLGTICASLVQMTQCLKSLILAPVKCRYVEWYEILPTTSNLRLCSLVKSPLHSLVNGG